MDRLFGICKGTNKLGGFVNSMYVHKNEMNAKVRRMNDLEVFIPRREQRVGKFPLDSQQSP